jgi:hypothetical protein
MAAVELHAIAFNYITSGHHQGLLFCDGQLPGLTPRTILSSWALTTQEVKSHRSSHMFSFCQDSYELCTSSSSFFQLARYTLVIFCTFNNNNNKKRTVLVSFKIAETQACHPKIETAGRGAAWTDHGNMERQFKGSNWIDLERPQELVNSFQELVKLRSLK